MTGYKPGDIVLVSFPFTDLRFIKQRPALILNSIAYHHQHADAIILALTSQPQANRAALLDKWQTAGLPKPTWLKSVIATISLDLINRRLGPLHRDDYPKVQTALRRAIHKQFLTG